MSITAIALNTNLTHEQAAELIKRETDNFVRMCDVVSENMKSMSPDDKVRYLTQCLPILMMCYF